MKKCKITSVGLVLCLCLPVLAESKLRGGEGVGGSWVPGGSSGPESL